MSAKKNSQQPKPAPAAPGATPASATPVPAAALTADTPWIESSDPRRRLWGQIALAAIWIYVAALWLLALDQWFNWGIFGPKVPPVP